MPISFKVVSYAEISQIAYLLLMERS